MFAASSATADDNVGARAALAALLAAPPGVDLGVLTDIAAGGGERLVVALLLAVLAAGDADDTAAAAAATAASVAAAATAEGAESSSFPWGRGEATAAAATAPTVATSPFLAAVHAPRLGVADAAARRGALRLLLGVASVTEEGGDAADGWPWRERTVGATATAGAGDAPGRTPDGYSRRRRGRRWGRRRVSLARIEREDPPLCPQTRPLGGDKEATALPHATTPFACAPHGQYTAAAVAAARDEDGRDERRHQTGRRERPPLPSRDVAPAHRLVRVWEG